MHFISDDRLSGGHVLEMEAEDASVSTAVISTFHVELPKSVEFDGADLTANVEGLHKVEG